MRGFKPKFFLWLFRLATGGFPTRFLPTVVPAGRLVGHTTSSWCLLPARVPVFVAMGDLQCSVLPKLKTDSDAGEFTCDLILKKHALVSIC